MKRISLVAQSARAGRESPAARPAAIQPDRFELLGAAALRDDASAVASRAALGRLDRRSGFRRCVFGRAGHPESIARPIFAVTNMQGGCGMGRYRICKGNGALQVVADLQSAGWKMDAVARC